MPSKAFFEELNSTLFKTFNTSWNPVVVLTAISTSLSTYFSNYSTTGKPTFKLQQARCWEQLLYILHCD